MSNESIRIDESYLKHRELERNNRISGVLPSCYLSPDSIDAWHHDRMRNIILPLIDFYPKTKWITLGDGRFGSDAFYLQNRAIDVLCTSISDETISEAHQLGYIDKYKAVNAEYIPENDNSFDFVFCKEAYHHFPRPMIALYEMLRIARKGVILIEPQEDTVKLFDQVKQIIKIILRKQASLSFEPAGNFIYRINIKELKKIMTALNMKYIAYKKFNDFSLSSFANMPKKGLNKGSIITSLGIGIQNILCMLRLMNYGLATVVLFKDDVNQDLFKILDHKGFRVKELPKNPYI